MITLTQAEKEAGLILPRLETDFKNAGIDISNRDKLNSYQKQKLTQQCKEILAQRGISPTPTRIEQIRAYIPELSEIPNQQVGSSGSWKNYVANIHPGYAKTLKAEYQARALKTTIRNQTRTIGNHQPMPDSLLNKVIDYSLGSLNDDEIRWLMRNKKISPEIREVIVSRILGIRHSSEVINGFDGLSKDGRPVEIKTESSLIGEEHYKLDGSHLFSSVSHATMLKKIKDNPIMAHAGFIDGKLAFIVTFMLGEMKHETLLRGDTDATRNRQYSRSDWEQLNFRVQFRNDELMQLPNLVCPLRDLIMNKPLWKSKPDLNFKLAVYDSLEK